MLYKHADGYYKTYTPENPLIDTAELKEIIINKEDVPEGIDAYKWATPEETLYEIGPIDEVSVNYSANIASAYEGSG